MQSPGRRGEQQTLVRISFIDDDSQATLREREIDAQVIQESAWTDLGRHGFDPPQLFSAFLHSLRWNLVTSTNPRGFFQSPYRAGIEERTPAEKKSGAGQYFTPRPLIDCIVPLMKPKPAEIVHDPAAGTCAGFSLRQITTITRALQVQLKR
jgi:hypothetical protein